MCGSGGKRRVKDGAGSDEIGLVSPSSLTVWKGFSPTQWSDACQHAARAKHELTLAGEQLSEQIVQAQTDQELEARTAVWQAIAATTDAIAKLNRGGYA